MPVGAWFVGFVPEGQIVCPGTLLASDVGVWLERDPDTVHEPDIACTSTERLPLDAWNAGYSEVVEVASPRDALAL